MASPVYEAMNRLRYIASLDSNYRSARLAGTVDWNGWLGSSHSKYFYRFADGSDSREFADRRSGQLKAWLPRQYAIR